MKTKVRRAQPSNAACIEFRGVMADRAELTDFCLVWFGAGDGTFTGFMV